ncbi:MAG: ABC transporter permease, partial [Bacillota bacterium]|nr:ABC transporter permease [Bacillota bacterium]
MVAKALNIKAVRDMIKSKAQFLSIFAMAALTILIVSGLDSLWKTIGDETRSMYAATNISDLWVTAPDPSEIDMWGVKRISGVKSAEKRFVANAEAGLEGKPALRLYAMPDKNTLDTPKIVKGGLKSRGGAVLDVNFAAANGINIGD